MQNVCRMEGNMQGERTYIAIDLKSFYASVECVERGLDPLLTNLVVADKTRTTKTICLAVSPSLKSYGVSGRARLFEVVQKVRNANAERLQKAPGHVFVGKSCDLKELEEHPEYELDYIVATPRMAYYMEYSTKIYDIYLKYIAPEDMHVYSVDEVFMDVTSYLNTYRKTPRQLAETIVKDVFDETGITATAGIGTNMYLCKIAMDIVAKHTEPDENGVRMAELDEMTYRKMLWGHRPITDFWRVGRGYAKKLAEHGMYTMGDVARCSVGGEYDYQNEDLLYRLFGVNAELLIDHAWGYEPCTIKEIKEYKPLTNSLGSGQVLKCPYDYEKAKVVVMEMADMLALDLVDKGLVTDQIVLTVGYDIENLTNPERRTMYRGAVMTDNYGRKIPKHAHGTTNLERYTSSSRLMTGAVEKLYENIVNKNLLIRRITITANHVVKKGTINEEKEYEQMDLFTDYEKLKQKNDEEKEKLEREEKMQKAVLDIKKKYGKNYILKGMNFREGGTARERNGQIGGHKA